MTTFATYITGTSAFDASEIENDSCEDIIRSQMGATGTDDVASGHTFIAVLVPNKAQIDSATLTFTPKGPGEIQGSAPVNLDILAEQVDEATDFLKSAGRCDVLTRITNALAAGAVTVNWPDIDTEDGGWIEGTTPVTLHPSPDIKTILQQIVNRPGWEGNALSNLDLLLHDDGSSGGYVLATSFEFGAIGFVDPPHLSVDFTPASIAVKVIDATVSILEKDDDTITIRATLDLAISIKEVDDATIGPSS